MSLDFSDPRLTAYALDELDAAERAEVEAQLAGDPERRRLVEEIRATARLLTEHLQNEPSPKLAPEQREAIETRLQSATKPKRRWYHVSWVTVAASLSLLAIGLGLLLPRQNAVVFDRVQTSVNSVKCNPVPNSIPYAAARQSTMVTNWPEIVSQAEPKPPFTIKLRDELEPQPNTEAYDRIVDNPFLRVAQNPLSTFSIDVDTASYANVRRFLDAEHAARPRTPSGSRSCSTTSPTTTRPRRATSRSRSTSRSPAAPGTPSTGWRGSA